MRVTPPRQEELCDEHLTYLEITASTTGYQPDRRVTQDAEDRFPEVPIEDLVHILSEYFACCGVVLNVAIFRHGPVEERRKRREPDFGELEPATRVLSNPYRKGPLTFRATGEANNRTVDRYPQLGDRRGELDMFTETVVTFSATSRAEAKVAHFGPLLTP